MNQDRSCILEMNEKEWLLKEQEAQAQIMHQGRNQNEPKKP